jgi:hypothetical protein
MAVRWIILCELIEYLGCRPYGLQISQTVVAYAIISRGAPPAPTRRWPGDVREALVASPPRSTCVSQPALVETLWVTTRESLC